MKKEQYGENKSYEFLLEEVVASACEMMLKDSKAITKLAQEHYTLVEKIKAFIDAFVEKIKKAFEGVSSRSIEAMIIEDALNDLTQMQEIFDNALIEAVHNSREVINDEIIYDENGDMMFSIRNTQKMSWEKQINALLQKKGTIKHSDTLVLKNNTPSYLVESGIEDLPLAVRISAITKARSGKDESHSISDINLVNLKNAIENPIAVINDIDRNSLLFVTNLKQNNGNIVVTFEKSTLFDGDRVHKATSIHSREDMTEYFNNLNNSEIYSLNENKLTVVSGSSIDLERLKQNNKFTKINISQVEADVKKEKRVNSEFEAKYLELAKEPEKNKDKLQRMVDEAAKKAGYVVKAYHGTPNGDFTVFRNWQYFTESKEHADVYQNQGASSNGYKLTANNPKTYSVYLKQDKIFDTRNEKEKRIFENKFYRQWGNGAPLSEKGLPDWTDGDDFVEFFEENDYDYDAILLDEGATGGFGDEVKSRGISIVVKNSNQIKTAEPIVYDDNGDVIPLSERFNDSKSDIRYSLRNDETDKKYSYDELISKPDMEIVKLDEVTDDVSQKYKSDTKLFANEMIAIARKANNHKNTNTATYLHNDDTDSDIMIAKTSFMHGAARLDKSYIDVSGKLSNILKNAIAVNELNPRENSNGVKVFIGMAEYSDDYVFVRMIVDSRTQKLNDYDILYAIQKKSIKKKGLAQSPRITSTNEGSDIPSTISIYDLLQNVKNVKLVSSVLSEDVCDKLGIERPDSVFKDDLKFSLRDLTPAQKVARRILKTSDVADLESMYVDVAEKLEEIYSLVGDGKNASEQTKALANEIFDNMVVSNKDNQELYTTLLQTVKDYRIKITDEMKLGFGDDVNLIKSVYPLDDFKKIITKASE